MKRGFTFIELLVVISIMLLMSGLGIANFIKYKEKKQLETTAQAVRELAVTARNRAQARQTPITTDGICDPQTSPILAYHLESTNNGNIVKIEIRPVCGTDLTDLTNESSYVGPDDSLTIPGNFSLTPSSLSVYFYSLKGGAKLGQQTISVAVNNGSTKFGFDIDESGAISEVKEMEMN